MLFIEPALWLIIIGFILIVLEIFIVPGGIVGGIGALMMLAGVFVAADSVSQALLYLVIILLVIIVILLIAWKSGRLGKLWRKISLHEKQDNSIGYVAPKEEYSSYLNKTGVALSLLRPAGTAEIDGEKVDVVSEGNYIEQGSRIKVLMVEGTRIVVRRDEQ